jgi:ABC-type multidrug transport system ATPase subunit
MDEAQQCHRITLMNDGKIVALDTINNLKNHYFPDATSTHTLEDVFIRAIESVRL